MVRNASHHPLVATIAPSICTVLPTKLTTKADLQLSSPPEGFLDDPSERSATRAARRLDFGLTLW
ncbi:hypothetical protein AUP68_16341 [Ilyonectria robusta]